MTGNLTGGGPSRGTVLLVDDEPDVLRAMDRCVRGLGYRTVSSTKPSEALTLLSLRSFEAVIADLRLPMDLGGVFASHARALGPDLPLIVVTGMQDLREICSLLVGARVDAIVLKDAFEDGLAAALDRFLAGSRDVVGADRNGRLIAEGLVRALAFRDSETEGHSRRVAAWTLILAQRMGVPRTDWSRIELGAMLHDVGKMGVSDAILRKRGPLTEEEWVEMRQHPEFGSRILSGIPPLADARDIVRSHHERWDGKGYPDGLAGEAVPRYARIFSVVDTYDALTADRPYRKGRSHEVATDIICAETGKQFEPSVVEAFLGTPLEDWLAVAKIFVDDRASFSSAAEYQ